MDAQDTLDQLGSMIENARSMPMSASCVINRADALALVDRLRELLPAETASAHDLGGELGGELDDAQAIRREADEYVDQQLATLEVILNKALASVQRGRDRLHTDRDELGTPADLR